jgi:hypothetical protein
MRVETSPGPNGAAHNQSSHYVYDVRSGVIVGIYHFFGVAPKSEQERLAAMQKTSHEVSGVALEDLAVLTNLDVPPGQGELRIDAAEKQLLRACAGSDLRVRP